MSHSQHGESQRAPPSPAQETYVDNGLVCLKHKIRNTEKKKLKSEDCKEHLKKGEQLNPDKLEAVEKCASVEKCYIT